MKKWIFILITLIMGCKATKDNKLIDLQGHRGCRGILPENTIPAFIRALELGVTTLEMDVCITKDRKVIISHEPFMSHEICTKPGGEAVSKEEELALNIYEMTYDSTRAFDCGLKDHPRFPEQEKMMALKPLLEEAIDTIEAYIKANDLAMVHYNVEIKSNSLGDDKYHPKPEIFADMVMAVIQQKGIEKRTIIQSFDKRPLQVMHEKYPGMTTAILVEFPKPPADVIKGLGHIPEIYSPYFYLIDEELLAFCREKNMKLIPWTVNEESDIEKVLAYGVDGIITDFPGRVKRILDARPD